MSKGKFPINWNKKNCILVNCKADRSIGYLEVTVPAWAGGLGWTPVDKPPEEMLVPPVIHLGTTKLKLSLCSEEHHKLVKQILVAQGFKESNLSLLSEVRRLPIQ